jgi:hypothetical protein
MKIGRRGRDYDVWRVYCALEKSTVNKLVELKENGFTLESAASSSVIGYFM